MSEHELGLALFRTLVFIRRFEETVQTLFSRGVVYGSTHLCIGQEAVSVGVCGEVQDKDMVAATYRGHGHSLALGVDPGSLLSELLGRKTGICGGRAGSMNIVDLKHRLLGCFGIVGGSIAAATGAALALKRRGQGVAVAFFGDGAVNQAYFHECLNFAAVNSLPVVFVCENNQYGEFTPMAQVTAGTLLQRPRTFGIESVSADGNDVWEMRKAAKWALGRSRSGSGPTFIEALTYRFSDHGRGDPVKYRPAGEMEAWRTRDPLVLARARLVDKLGVASAAIDATISDVENQLAAVTSTALDAPFPEFGEEASEFKPASERSNAD